MRYIPAVLFVWCMLSLVALVFYNWAKYLYIRKVVADD